VKIIEVLVYVSAEYKLYAKTISRRISATSNPCLMKNKTDLENEDLGMASIFAIQQLLGRHREYTTEKHLLFVDYVKTLVSVARKEI
jgi:hypothetical protein